MTKPNSRTLLSKTNALHIGVMFLVMVMVTGAIGPIHAQVFRGYYPGGNIEIESTRKRNKQIIKGYYPDGNIQFIAHTKRNELDGKFREFYQNGVLKAEIEYRNDKRHGLARFFHKNGMLLCKVEYRRDKIKDPVQFYTPNGHLTRKPLPDSLFNNQFIENKLREESQ